jgi:hypothetical protein
VGVETQGDGRNPVQRERCGSERGSRTLLSFIEGGVLDRRYLEMLREIICLAIP